MVSGPPARPEVAVRPDFEVPEGLPGAVGDQDPVGLAVVKDHAAGVVPPAVVFLVGQAAQLLVPELVAGAERLRQIRPLAARPELPLELLALVGLDEIEEDLLLFRADDRSDELREPLAFLFGQR